MSFENLKSMRGSSIDQLVKAAGAVSEKTETKSYIDERFWKPTQDKAGNGYAVVRFLPAKEGEDLPWVRYWDHGFKGPNGLWYIENSLTTINQPDPVSEMNTQLWNTGREEDKATARERKRRLHYVSNILVISDSANPAAEGKVFLYRYGKKIFDKIMEAMQPEFEDESPINPFDFWQGANFKLKIVKKDGFWNYDKSEFDSVAPLLDDDDALEAIWKKEYSLAAVTAADQFKSYEDLERRLKYVLGKKPAQQRYIPDEELEDESEGLNSRSVAEETVTRAVSTPTSSTTVDKDEDDALSYFQKLAES